MQKTIFRREFDPNQKPKEKGSLKNLIVRKRRNMTPFITFFSRAEKLKIIKNIFNHDSGKFLIFMDELDTKLTWAEAYTLMETEFIKRNINIFSDKAKVMTDRIYNVFFPEEISMK